MHVDSYAPVIEHDYEIVRAWVLHNEAHRKMIVRYKPKAKVPLMQIGYAEYLRQYEGKAAIAINAWIFERDYKIIRAWVLENEKKYEKALLKGKPKSETPRMAKGYAEYYEWYIARMSAN